MCAHVDLFGRQKYTPGCVFTGRLQRSFCPLRVSTTIRHVRTEPSAAASFVGAPLDGGHQQPATHEAEKSPNLAQQACSTARSFMHHIIAVAIPAWLALKRSQFNRWVAEGEAKADAMGILRNAKRTALIIPFASAVTGAKGPSELFIMLNQAVYHFVNLYLLFLFIRCVPHWVSLHALIQHTFTLCFPGVCYHPYVLKHTCRAVELHGASSRIFESHTQAPHCSKGSTVACKSCIHVLLFVDQTITTCSDAMAPVSFMLGTVCFPINPFLGTLPEACQCTPLASLIVHCSSSFLTVFCVAVWYLVALALRGGVDAWLFFP